MAKNSSMASAKVNKKDEFYTPWHIIEKEITAYHDYNPDVFKDKVIMCPCDPEWSKFTEYFAQNFERFGHKKLICTAYANIDMSLCGNESKEANTDPRGKVFIVDRDINSDGRINFKDLQWQYLEGDGDFRSEEVKKLRDEADFIITNPPFSLFREFIEWIGDKQFAIIGTINAITYKNVFPKIRDNKIWLGCSGGKGDYTTPGGKTQKFGLNCWYTNIEHGRRHEPLKLMTMADNLKFNPKIKKCETAYKKYDNYDAIEVPFTMAIPSDYEGVMGVPISFLEKYNPDQFEIVQFRKGDDGKDLNVGGGTVFQNSHPQIV